MSYRARLLAALLLLIAIVGVCASYQSQNVLMTVFRAAQAAAAIGMVLALAAVARSGCLTRRDWNVICHMTPPAMPRASIPPGRVLLC
jgi:chromate transport protein ChrA